MAQQVASLPQKLKTSFEPILGPVITRNLAEKRFAAVAQQVSQVGFWIIAAQAGIALALGIPGEAVKGLVGPEFVGGAGALAFLLAAEVVAATAVVNGIGRGAWRGRVWQYGLFSGAAGHIKKKKQI